MLGTDVFSRVLTLVTTLVELDLARARHALDGGGSQLAKALLATARNTLIHPVVLPVLIGMSLAYCGVQGAEKVAVVLSVLKLVVLPAVVLAIAYRGFRLDGLPIAMIAMMAALPIGSKALIFARRYRTLETEVTASPVLSTLAFVVAAPAWLPVLAVLY